MHKICKKSKNFGFVPYDFVVQFYAFVSFFLICSCNITRSKNVNFFAEYLLTFGFACAILCMSKKWEKCTFFVHHIHSFIALKKFTFLEFFYFAPYLPLLSPLFYLIIKVNSIVKGGTEI